MGKTLIVAEAGVNHNGSLDMALKLIELASWAGANIVKFQSFKSEQVVSKYAAKSQYQAETTPAGESQLDMIKKLELDAEQQAILVQHCQAAGIEFMSTPFDLESIDLLANSLQVSRIKISSGEITNAPLLLKAAQTGKPIILSTGMSTLGEIETALGVLAFGYTMGHSPPDTDSFRSSYASFKGQQSLQSLVTLLHCTSEYPAPINEVNLRALDTLHHAFGLPVGYSDHTEGINIPLAAVAKGAVLIEKHFTISRDLPGPDHRASLEPRELRQMVSAIHEVELALGSPRKHPTPSEIKNIRAARKSLVAARPIRAGETFSQDNLGIKRPGTGINPFRYWQYLGQEAKRDYGPDEEIEPVNPYRECE